MKQSSPVGENLRKLILISKFYQNFYLENKSVSSVYIYVLVFYSFVCCVFVVYGCKNKDFGKSTRNFANYFLFCGNYCSFAGSKQSTIDYVEIEDSTQLIIISTVKQ